MDYLLSEEEYKEMIPRSTHNKDCKKHRSRIKELKATESKLKAECKAQYGKDGIDTQEFQPLLEIMVKNAKRIIRAVAEKQGGIINDVMYIADYRDKEGNLHDSGIESIDSNGKVTLEDEDVTTHLDGMIADNIIGILYVLPDEDMENV